MRTWMAGGSNAVRVGGAVAALVLFGAFAARTSSADVGMGAPFQQLEAKVDACCGSGGLGAVAVVSGVSACDTTRSKIFQINCAPGQVAVGGGYQVETCDGSAFFLEGFAAAADEPAGDVGSAPSGWYVAVWDVQARINGQAASSASWRVAVRASCVAP